MHQSTTERSCNRNRERERDKEKYMHRKERDSGRRRSRDRERDRDRNKDRDGDRNRDKERERDRERSRHRDRDRSNKDSEERNRKNDHDRYSSRSRGESKCSRSSSIAKSDHRSNYARCSKLKSIDSRTRSSSRSASVKPEPSPARSNDADAMHVNEKHAACDDKEPTERARILEKWRSNFCETSEDITRKLEELAEDGEKECWIRSSPADLYYKRTSVNEIEGTARLEALCTLFKTELVDRCVIARQLKPAVDEKPKKRKHRVCRHKSKTINCIKSIFV